MDKECFVSFLFSFSSVFIAFSFMKTKYVYCPEHFWLIQLVNLVVSIFCFCFFHRSVVIVTNETMPMKFKLQITNEPENEDKTKMNSLVTSSNLPTILVILVQ